MKLQCSVCWEDFTIDEKVMKLACDHMFHKDCIIPWLELVSFFSVTFLFNHKTQYSIICVGKHQS